MKKCFILIAIALGVISCGNRGSTDKSSNKIVYEDYLPFQFADGGKWGMVSADGKILFSEKYDGTHSVINDEGEIEDIEINISPALNGLYLMTNKSGTRDYYTATKEPKLTFGGFQEAGLFREDVAPTVKKGEWIKFINKKGKTVFDFKEVNGVNVKKVSNFYSGVAIFELEDETYGCIDTEGKVIVKPQSEKIEFCSWSGYVLENGIITMGNKIFNLQKGWEIDQGDEYYYSKVFSPYSDYFALEVRSDESFSYAIYDSEGQKIKQTRHSIMALSGEYYIFEKDKKLGIVNLKGDIIMPPSYDAMVFIDYDKVLCADMEYKGAVKILNLSGDLIFREYTEQPISFIWNHTFWLCYRGYKNKMTFLRNMDGDFVFIDNKGNIVSNERIKTLVDFQRYTLSGLLSNYEQGEWVHSDYFDSESIVRRISLTDVGACGVTPNNTLKDFYDKFSNDIFNDDIRNYLGNNKILPISLNMNGVSLGMNVYFMADVYPDYRLAFNEKPYVLDLTISESNFSNSDDYSYLFGEETNNSENVKMFFEYLYTYYCGKYHVMKKEKKEKSFYLEIIRKNDANSIVVYHDNECVHICISESERSLHYYYENLK